ncbi:MAG: radical SAM protein [Deltaproteobacteria bacterium]|nr:radical SAM protein [Deltaproteobacteria bacterium]
MESSKTKGLKITVNKQGSPYYLKVSYPLRFGKFTEIETEDYIFCFDLNNRIKFIQGKKETIGEQFKLNCAADWIYYCVAGYKGVYSFLGEYYLPCFGYAKNPLFDIYSYNTKLFKNIFNAFLKLVQRLEYIIKSDPLNEINQILKAIITVNHSEAIKKRVEEFYKITSGVVTVLPPDCRHVDYEVIPLNITYGCLYNCGFCSVKKGIKFKTRSITDILYDIKRFKTFYSADIANYNSLFLGEHDALNAESKIIIDAAKTAYNKLGFQYSYMKNPMLFLFGSVDSLINAKKELFEALNSLPFYTYINIGMESADNTTFRLLKKPLVSKKIKEAFDNMLLINQKYMNIEITANFVMGDMLSDEHYQSIITLSKSAGKSFYGKGAFYISPLEKSGAPSSYVQKKFLWLKNSCAMPTYIYIIQRL